MTDTDLEQRLGAALVRASDDAPSADGLAARVAARRRRSRRTAVAGVGAVLAVAVAVVAVMVVPRLLTGSGGASYLSETPAAPTLGWQTVTVDAGSGGDDAVELEVPGDWMPLDSTGCEFSLVGYGPAAADPCTGDRSASVYGSATFDPADLPGGISRTDGQWSGYVLTGDVAVSVALDDRAVVRRVLASVRPEGEAAPDVETWTRVAAEDPSDIPGLPSVTAEVPGDPEVSVTLAAGFPDCEPGRVSASPGRGDGWDAGLCRDRIVSVRAPTQALADVVAASVRGY